MVVELPAGIATGLPAWEEDLAVALGYTLTETDGMAPTCWNLPVHPFAFLEDTGEVVIWEVDGPLNERGFREAHVDPMNPTMIAMRARRAPIPAGFALQTITTIDGATHRIAIRDA